MKYAKIKSYEMSEDQLRKLWLNTYCLAPLTTWDGLVVSFTQDMFDHAFFESIDRREKDKSILSFNRCEKMLWIKDTLEDSEAILKVGWNTKTRTYDNSRRVALVKGNYVVVVRLIKSPNARFVTAFQIDDEGNLQKLLSGPDWAA